MAGDRNNPYSFPWCMVGGSDLMVHPSVRVQLPPLLLVKTASTSALIGHNLVTWYRFFHLIGRGSAQSFLCQCSVSVSLDRINCHDKLSSRYLKISPKNWIYRKCGVYSIFYMLTQRFVSLNMHRHLISGRSGLYNE